MEQAQRGEAALNAGKYDEAIAHYNEALKQSPSAATYYIKRSTAYQRTKKYVEAFNDAELGVMLAVKRAKREMIAQAQLRRGIALYFLERYGDSLFCLELATKLNQNEHSASMWESKARSKLNDLPEDDEKKKVTIKEVPDVSVPVASKEASRGQDSDAALKDVSNTVPPSSSSMETRMPLDSLRHEWYQTNDNVIVSWFAKEIPTSGVTVDIEDSSVHINIPWQGSTYAKGIGPLHALIDPLQSKYRVLSKKIEVTLRKAVPGDKWPALEGPKPENHVEAPTQTAASTSNSVPVKEVAPAYPTSSRKGPKNWDRIADSYVKPKNSSVKSTTSDSKDTTKPASMNDDEDSDQVYINEFGDDEDDVNAFFKQLYSNADPDTRRAMMKSYQESGGTALSTNWGEVKNKTYDIEPPEGMEVRKWEQ